jgi:hypothetical protein
VQTAIALRTWFVGDVDSSTAAGHHHSSSLAGAKLGFLVLLLAALGFFLVRHPLAMLVKTRKRVTVDRASLWGWTAIYGGITALSSGWLILAQGLWGLAILGLVGGMLLLFNLWHRR